MPSMGSDLNANSAAKRGTIGQHKLISAEFIRPFVLVTFLFFLWGVPNNLNDVLIRQFMKSFEITRFKAGLIQSVFYMGYFLFSMPAALLMRKYGYKMGLVTGLVLYGTGALLFWPAALMGEYGYFLFALFVIASGLSFLETGANPFMTQLGDPASAARRLNFAQAFNPFGAIAGALGGTIFIFSGIELTRTQVEVMKAAGTYTGYLRHETLRVVAPYIVLGCIALAWAFLIWRTRFPAIGGEGSTTQNKGSFRTLFRHRHFILAVLAQFFYVGAQVGTWSYFIQYVQDYTHQPEKFAGYLLTGTLVAFGVGRFSSTYLMQFIAPNKLMGLFAVVNIALVGVGVALPGWVGMWSVLLTSFFMSLMFPTIFALGLKDLGPDTKLGGSMIVMGIVGGAVLTPVMGLIATHSMALAMLIPLACYVFIAYFSFIGSRVRGAQYAV